MTINECLAHAEKIDRREAELLAAHVLHTDRPWIIAHGDDPIPLVAARRTNALIARRAAHEPIAYILGEKEFYGRTFTVHPAVLIPRPETELLIDIARQKIPEDTPHRTCIWDVGTGSGALAITLKKERPLSTVLATDTSTKALSIAQKNAKHHNVHITWMHADLYALAVRRWIAATHAQRLLIIANLPYLPISDTSHLDPDVVHFEPHQALFAGDDGLDIIRAFLHQLSRNRASLPADTTILLEYDPPQTIALRVEIHKHFPHSHLTTHQDSCGRDRVMEIEKL